MSTKLDWPAIWREYDAWIVPFLRSGGAPAGPEMREKLAALVDARLPAAAEGEVIGRGWVYPRRSWESGMCVEHFEFKDGKIIVRDSEWTPDQGRCVPVLLVRASATVAPPDERQEGEEPLTQQCDQCGRKFPAFVSGCFNAQGDDDCDGTLRPIVERP